MAKLKALKFSPTLCREQVPPPQQKPESAVGKKKIGNSIHGPGKAKGEKTLQSQTVTERHYVEAKSNSIRDVVGI